MDWLAEALTAALKWQLANPGAVASGDAPRVPAAGWRVWGMFLALHAARGAGFSGPLPIAPSEIEALARLRREPVRPFEVEIILSLDRVYCQHVAEKQKARDGDTVVMSDRPMSAALFDAVMG